MHIIPNLLQLNLDHAYYYLHSAYSKSVQYYLTLAALKLLFYIFATWHGTYI